MHIYPNSRWKRKGLHASPTKPLLYRRAGTGAIQPGELYPCSTQNPPFTANGGPLHWLGGETVGVVTVTWGMHWTSQTSVA